MNVDSEWGSGGIDREERELRLSWDGSSVYRKVAEMRKWVYVAGATMHGWVCTANNWWTVAPDSVHSVMVVEHTSLSTGQDSPLEIFEEIRRVS